MRRCETHRATHLPCGAGINCTAREVYEIQVVAGITVIAPD
jgi:hypothetical protein